jgi:hypothetical protein
MTITDCNTQTPAVVRPPFTAEQLTGLRANVAQAQAAADLAYEVWQEAGATPEELADVYHATFIESMRALGTPMPCSCATCIGATAA